MVEIDPLETQRDVGIDVVTELNAAGFADAEEIGRGGFGEVYRCFRLLYVFRPYGHGPRNNRSFGKRVSGRHSSTVWGINSIAHQRFRCQSRIRLYAAATAAR